MSEPSWIDSLAGQLNSLRRADGAPPRVAVVGVGHELRGDDGAGVAVVRALRPLALGADRVLAIEAGPAPENHTGPVRRFRPDLVLIVDAAQMGLAPGTVRWLSWEATSGVSASTHTLPPYVLARFLSADLRCAVALLGMQPARTSVGAPLSTPVRQAVEATVQSLAKVLLTCTRIDPPP